MYIEITQDTGLCNSDGEFRSYELITSGETLEHLIDNARIVEIDQDGGDHEIRDLGEYCERVYKRCMIIIAKAWIDSELGAA